MNEEDLIKHKLLDTANQAYKNNTFTFTNFLSMSELSIFYSMRQQLSFIDFEVFGGNDICERCVLKFGNKDILGYDIDYPIDTIKICPMTPKFAENLSHRDYLGALMNLGIKRELLGDILIKEKIAYLFCLDHITDFIITNLHQVKHTGVKLMKVESADLAEVSQKKENLDLIAASARIDAVVSSITKLSRSKVKELFLAKKIFVNGMCNENVSYNLKSNDILVIRGVGKFIFIGNGKETKSGRVYVNLQKYT